MDAREIGELDSSSSGSWHSYWQCYQRELSSYSK